MTSGMSNFQVLQDFVNAKIATLYAGYDAGLSSARAELATLRRAGTSSLNNFDINAVIPEAAILLFDGLPDQLRGCDDTALGKAEQAAYAALVLYAKHQQSQARCVNVRGVSLGKAIGRAKDDNGLVRQFKYLCGARNFGSQMQSLGHIVAMLKRKDIGLDYGRLAKDLYFLQGDNDNNRVYVGWCRDMYINPKPASKLASIQSDNTANNSAETEN